MSEWVKWLLLGILSVVFGIFVLGNTFAASIAVTVVTGVVFLISGGLQVFAGSDSQEFAEERHEWGHGAFTKALLEAMKDGKADELEVD